MATKRHLNNAPIREALIDIRCQPAASLDAVSQFAGRLVKPGYQIADLWEATMEMKLEQGQPPPAPSHTASLIGKRIDFADRRNVVQLKTTGCTYSRLAPYETWEAMTDHAFEVWGDFVKAVPFEAVERIAVRYINSIQLPLPILDFATYLNCPPVIPQGLPQEVGGFVSRISFSREGDVATVTQMIESGTPGGDFLNILVDIEVATTCSHRAADADSIRTTAKRLREFKNDVFFGFLTDSALERYA
ncbi:MAG TPA: TIGR04255 family protein [Burkholderiaceae bacterium]|nr:TIGR04255 family protein [Burkholderiaceae bacterium]